MDAYKIIDICHKQTDKFHQILSECAPFSVKGILHSEMLLFCSLIDYFKCQYVIESGRARGQSTEIIARFIQNKNIQFDSIERNQYSEDYLMALERLQFLSVNLLDGDSTKLIPNKLYSSYRSTAVLIDGPKGRKAWRLARKILRQFTKVKFVAIHDMHRSRNKNLLEKIDNSEFESYSSEYMDFINMFSSLDKECWKINREYNDPEIGIRKDLGRDGWVAPYERVSGEVISYGPTLLCIFNESARDKLNKEVEDVSTNNR